MLRLVSYKGQLRQGRLVSLACRSGDDMKANSMKRCLRLSAILMMVFSLAIHGDQEILTPTKLLDALNFLKQGSMAEREQAVNQLADLGASSLPILQALLDGKLFTLKSDVSLVVGIDNNQGYAISDALSGSEMGAVERSAVNKINLTNNLRVALRKIIGQLQLSADDPAIRLSAIKAMANEEDGNTLSLLQARATIEKDQSVQQAINIVLLLKDMNSNDKLIRIKAIDLLKEQNNRDVVNRLNTMVEKDESGNFIESDAEIRAVAKAALVNINSRLQIYSAIETVFFGLSLGAVLVLAAIGLAITFGVMGVINMAHGELMMLGAYTTYVIQQLMPNHLGISVILSIPVSFVISALVGIVIERGIIRFLYGRPLETLLATFGVSLILQQSVRSIFSPLNRSVATPEWMSGSWQINDT